MAASGLHISISAEKLFSIGDLAITNSMFTSMIVSTILITFAFVVNKQLTQTNNPKGLQNFAEMIIETLHKLVNGITGDLKKTRLFLPIISTFFLWILLNNWLGLVPGVGTISIVESAEPKQYIETQETQEHSFFVQSAHAANTPELLAAANSGEGEHATTKLVPVLRPGTADLNTTLALGIISVLATQIFGMTYLQLGYFKKFINFSSPIMFFVGILELISEFAKIISFAFRLFGNIFAGEVLLVVMAFLLPIIVPMPFYGLELFVGFIQALVFSLLSLVFFNMATISHDEEH